MIPSFQLTALIAAIVAALAFGGGYTVADWRLTGQYDAERLTASQQAAEALADVTADRDALAGKLAAANDQHFADLVKAQNETNRLRDALASRAIGLRIAATCPRFDAAPSAPGPGVDSGTGAELDSTARSAYFALRDGINRASAQLAGCQDQLKQRTQTTSVDGTQ